MSNENRKLFFKNISYSFLVQIVGLLTSFTINLFLPKILQLEAFNYWQLFLLYSSYTGFFMLGSTDGLYLKYAGYDYAKLPHSEIGSQFRVVAFLQFLIGLAFVLFSVFYLEGEKSVVVICTAAYFIVFNLWWQLNYLFQAVNDFKKVAVANLLDKIVICACFIILFSLAYDCYLPYVVVYIAASLCALIYLVVQGRQIVLCKMEKFTSVMPCLKDTIKSGCNLMIGNYAGMLVVSNSKFLVDWKMGIQSFGVVSYALSMVAFFLTFISRFSVVLFPLLKKKDMESNLKGYYLKINTCLNMFLPFLFVFYPCAQKILMLWLPKFSESLNVLTWLLLVCVFDAKMNLLYNTYLKIFRMERFIFKINIITMVLSTVLCYIILSLFSNINYVVAELIFVICGRSIVTSMILRKKLQVKFDLLSIVSSLLCVMLVFTSAWLNYTSATIVNFFFVAVFVLFCKKERASVISLIRGK